MYRHRFYPGRYLCDIEEMSSCIDGVNMNVCKALLQDFTYIWLIIFANSMFHQKKLSVRLIPSRGKSRRDLTDRLQTEVRVPSTPDHWH